MHLIPKILRTACLALATITIAAAAAEDSAWVKLFNGKDLNDWDVKIRYQNLNVDPNHTFKVVDGKIFVDYSEYQNFNGEPFGHMGYKVRPFSHYLLRAEYQFIPGTQVNGGPNWAKENNGLMLHSQSMASMEKNQDFPISVEAQLLGAANDNGKSTMNVCTPATHVHDMNGNRLNGICDYAIQSNPLPAPDWVKVSALVLGDSIFRHMVGNDTVFRYQKSVMGGGYVDGSSIPIIENQPIKEGYIAIQAESAPTYFRTIELLDLVGCMDKSKPGYRSYFVKRNDAGCGTSSLRKQAQAFPYTLARNGLGLSVLGAQARLHEVRRPDGSLLVHLSNSQHPVTSWVPSQPGVYFISVHTSRGISTRMIPLF